MRSVYYSTTCLFILFVSLCVVYCESGTEIILNGTTTLFFSGSQIDSFFGCLCNSLSHTCTVSYEEDGDYYKITKTNQTKEYGTGDKEAFYNDKGVQCRVSKLNLVSFGEFHCTRLLEEHPCENRPRLTLCKVCDVGRINIAWLYGGKLASVTVRQRHDVIDSPPKTNHVTNNHDVTSNYDVTENMVVTNTDDSSKNKDDDIPLIAGLACGAVVIILIILIVFIVCRRQRQKSETANNKTKTIISPTFNPARDGTNNLARPGDSSDSNYEQCEIETGGLESSRKTIENRTMINNENQNDSKPINISNTTMQNNTTSVGNNITSDNHYCTIDTMYSNVADGTGISSPETDSKKPLAETVETAMKTKTTNYFYYNTVNDMEEPKLDNSVRTMDGVKPEIHSGREYEEI